MDTRENITSVEDSFFFGLFISKTNEPKVGVHGLIGDFICFLFTGETHVRFKRKTMASLCRHLTLQAELTAGTRL